MLNNGEARRITLFVNKENYAVATLATFFIVCFLLAFIISMQILGVPLWWVFRNLKPLSVVQLESRFEVLINKTPTNIGDKVLVTVLNATSHMPVQGAKVSLRKDGVYIYDYYTNASGQVLVEYLGEVTIIEVNKTGFETALEAIPPNPPKWVRNSIISIVTGIISAVVGSVMMYTLQERRKR